MKLSPTQIKEIAGAKEHLKSLVRCRLMSQGTCEKFIAAFDSLLAHIAAQDGEIAKLERERDEARARIAQLESQIVVKDAALKWDIEHCLQCCGTGKEAHREVLGSIPFDCPYCAKAREALKGSAK